MIDTGAAERGGSAKLCQRCGEDCSDRPRVRTRDGRYLCRPCESALAQQKRQGGPSQSASAADAKAEIIPLESVGTIPLADDQTIPIAVDTTIPLEEPDRKRSPKEAFAPKGGPAGVAAVAAALGEAPAVKACVKCGYSLEGVTVAQCPECGALNTRRAVRRERDAQHSAAIARNAYLLPIVLFCVCFTLASVLAYVSGRPDHGLENLLIHTVGTIVWAGLGFAGFLLCCAIWIGFDAPWHLNLVRFLAITAVTAAIYEFVGVIPYAGFLMTIVYVFVMLAYIGMLQKFLDLDLQDAVLVGVITTAVRWGTVLLAGILFGVPD